MILLAGASALALPQAAPTLVVVSKGLPGITLYDADTDREICKATVGSAPHEAAFSPDGKILYVPSIVPRTSDTLGTGGIQVAG